MKLTNEICVSFLRKSGWLYNHDKEITISERNNAIDDFGSKLEKDVLFTFDRIRAYERNKAIDDFEEKLLENAPKNYAGTLELGGMSCYLSANKVKQIAEKLEGGGVNE